MNNNILKIVVSAILMTMANTTVFSQTASPSVWYIDHSTETSDSVKLAPGDSQTAQAPLEFFCEANADIPEGWSAIYEWRFYKTEEGEDATFLTRYDEKTSYTLSASGSYSVKLIVAFTKDDGTTEEVTPDPFTIIISESELKCPNGFSPNGDDKNDVLRISCKSIVKLEASIFNRWGKKMAEKKISNLSDGYTENGTFYIDLWDGRYGGDYVKDGVYFLNLYAKGSDGIEYKEKKAINVIKGFNENTETNK